MEPEMERELEKLERKYEQRVTEVYNQAAADVTKKWEKYTADFARKDAVKKKLVEAGELSKEDYAKWRKGQILIGKRWREQVDVLSRDLVNADQIAVSLTRGYMAEAYALGHNYGTFLVEKGSLVNTSYTLYSRETVERLLKDQPRLLKVTKWELNHPKDMHWNQRHITDQITQGILQGEDIRQVSKRLQNVTGMDKGAAMRNARTAMTGAQNGGRMDAYERAAEMGIELEKEWLATVDKHTRESHIEIDGEHVPMDEPFSNGCMYPGDPQGAPEEVYNCRCTMIPRRAHGHYENEKRFMREEDLDGMSYEEWKESRGGRHPITFDYSGITADGYSFESKMKIEKFLKNDGETGELYKKYAGKMQAPIEQKSNEIAHYSPSEKRVHLNRAKVESGENHNDPYSVHFHEYGHNLDDLLGRPSANWRDAEGRTFAGVIQKDWDDSIHKFLRNSTSMNDLYEKEFLDQLGTGGMGGKEFLRYMTKEYRYANNLSRDSDEFRSVWNKIWEIGDSKEECLKFWRDNKDVFAPVLFSGDPTGTQVNAFCDFIKSNYTLKERSDISDMFEHYSVLHDGKDYPFGVGHGRGYWCPGRNEATEAFAEMTSATILQNKSLDLIKEYLPNSYSAYLEMVKGGL